MSAGTRGAAQPGHAAVLLATLLALLGAGTGDDAQDVVRQTLGRARIVVLGEGTKNQKLDALNAVAQELLDTRAMGVRAIGSELADQPAEQQREFLELFDVLIVRAYLQKLLFFRDPEFMFRESENSGSRVIVRTVILSGKDEFYVDYEMRSRDGRWLASDIVVEGISLSRNYHAQFASLLRTRSFEELLELMRRKTGKLRQEATG